MSSVLASESKSDSEQKAPPSRGRARKRGKELSGIRLRAGQILVFVVFLAAWEFAVSMGLVGEVLVSRPLKVWDKLVELAMSERLYSAAWVTTKEILVGLVLGTVLGVACGLVFALKPNIYKLFQPFVTTIYTVPRTALVGLFVIWFGLGEMSKIVLVVSLVFFSMLFNSYSGIANVDRNLVNAVRLMGGGNADVVRHVYLPSAVPWIFAGLRISLIFALTGAIVGEMLASRNGLGFLLQGYAALFDSAGVFAVLVIVAIFANCLSAVLNICERLMIRWKDDGPAST
ncbi:NitT/TauT family transport system permease protein [Sinosporangium album]|uniref:NitT/TauT family transport system permease protein n=1 Tax=Sinosporangium album TaxID=504805 RepID=A0A1G8FPR3_9ACTN|nr:ABC transporter permease [Sinosporangium album]SDH84125.1 NitT/TauT family transport system permease protein [Sinosporangium album]